VPTPPPLTTVDGGLVLAHRGLAISAFPWRGGHHLAPHEVSGEHAHALGRALAELHVAGLGLPPAWRRAGIYRFEDLGRRLAGFRDRDDPALASAIAILVDEQAWLAARAPLRASVPQGLIHGDLFRDNVLWDGTRLVALLDLEQVSAGSLIYDLAVVLNDWCWLPSARNPPATAGFPAHPPEDAGGEPAPALAAAVLAGYQAIRPLTDADRAALPVEVRAAAWRFTITRITDVYLRQLDTPDKDFRAFLARLVAWRGPSLGALLSSV
jgi:homoserine kinase type II